MVEFTARVYKGSKCKSVAEFSIKSGNYLNFVEKFEEIVESVNKLLEDLSGLL